MELWSWAHLHLVEYIHEGVNQATTTLSGIISLALRSSISKDFNQTNMFTRILKVQTQ